MWNRKEMSQLDAMLTRVPLTLTFDLEFLRSNCISGLGGPIVTERKERESIGCPDVKHKGNESTRHCTDWGTFDLDRWPWIFKVRLYLGNGKPDCHGTKGMGVNRMPWCKRQPLCDLEAEETVWDRGDLRCRRFRRLILVLPHFTEKFKTRGETIHRVAQYIIIQSSS